MNKKRILAGFAFISLTSVAVAQNSSEPSVDEFIDMSLNDLLQLEVSSVSRRLQQLREAAAAVHVITAEDIRRSGVTSIPEALRMVPGISVARINPSNWAITARGFNGSFSNKLLVLMDGRTLYTPSYSGTYWDVQDTMLDNIERIEVIRGPGATLWGANAVNGIINIITKSAEDMQGGLLLARAGNEEEGGLSLRYGDAVGQDSYLSGYLKLRKMDEQVLSATGAASNDGWTAARGGFRYDSYLTNGDSVAVDGAFYRSESDQDVFVPVVALTMPDEAKAEGWHLNGKLQRELDDGGALELSAYVDVTSRKEGALDQDHVTFDIDFQHDLADIAKHNIIWGVGYRHIEDEFRNSTEISFFPTSMSFDVFSAFVQDEITLTPEIRFTLGTKVEHNDYTGFEVQPNARIAWIPNERHMVWGAVSRAVRTPSRIEAYGRLPVGIIPGFPPTPIILSGDSSLESETLIAYEAGYRYTVENLSIDLAAFVNDYGELIGQNYLATPFLKFANDLEGQSHGVEFSLDWRAADWWRWQLAYTYQNIDVNASGPIPDVRTQAFGEGSVPEQQLSLRASLDISEDVQLDVWGRHVGRLETSNPTNLLPVPDYTTLDVRLAWQVTKGVEISVVGQNLLDSSHLEFVQESYLAPTEIQRGVFGQIEVSF